MCWQAAHYSSCKHRIAASLLVSLNAQVVSTFASYKVAPLLITLCTMLITLLTSNNTCKRCYIIMEAMKSIVRSKEPNTDTKEKQKRLRTGIHISMHTILLTAAISCALLSMCLLSTGCLVVTDARIDASFSILVLDICWQAAQNYSCKHRIAASLLVSLNAQVVSTFASYKVAPHLN